MIEICANSYASAIAAQNGGAIRVELCDNLHEGGTTPSYAQIALCRRDLHILLYPIIRPRGGDFLYNEEEFELMTEDIKMCRSLNCDGVVTGVLTSDGQIDKVRCAQLIKLASPMKVAFHRAFDMVKDKHDALETLISLGFERVLTSGGADRAINAVEVLKALVAQASGRISIMPGAGINAENLPVLIRQTGASEFHASAKQPVESKMDFRNELTKMGTAANEYIYEQTAEATVRHLVGIANSYKP